MTLSDKMRACIVFLVLAALSACGPAGMTSGNEGSGNGGGNDHAPPMPHPSMAPLRTVYVADPDHLPQVGRGYDPLLPTASPQAPYVNILKANGIPIPKFHEVPRISSVFEAVDREDTLEEYVGMSVGASARYGLISGSGSFCKSKSIKFHRRTLCIAFVYNAEYGYDEYQLTDGSTELALSAQAESYIQGNDAAAFRDAYGTELIDRVNKSVHIVVLYRFETNSSQQLDSMRAEFSAKYKSATVDAKVSGDFNLWVNRTHNGSSVSLEVYTAGLRTAEDSKVRAKIHESPNPHSITANVAAFLGGTKDGAPVKGTFGPESAVPTTFTTTPYPKVDRLSGVKGDASVWHDVFTYWKRSEAALKDAQVFADIQDARRQASLPSKTREEAEAYISDAQKHFDAVKRSADHYARTGQVDLKSLRLPTALDELYAYFYQDSKKWDMFTWLFLTHAATTAEHFRLVTPAERDTVRAVLRKIGSVTTEMSGGNIGRMAAEFEQRTELSLDASGPDEAVTSMAPLLAMTSLRTLSLRNQAIVELLPLQRLASLETLDLSNSEALTSNSLHSVLAAPKLKALFLKGSTNRIYNPSPADINTRMKSLEFLKHGDASKLEELYLNEQLWLYDIGAIKHAKSLRVLDLTNTGIGDEQIEKLSALGLEKLSLNSTRRINDVRALLSLKELADTLKELDLTRVGGNDDFGQGVTNSDGLALLGHDAAGPGSVDGRRTWVVDMRAYLMKKAREGTVMRGLGDSAMEGLLPNTMVTWDESMVHGRGDSRPHVGFAANDAPNVR